MYIIFIIATMKQTTVTINPDLHYTARITEAKKNPGGFSGYISQLIEQDFKTKGISILKSPINEQPIK